MIFACWSCDTGMERWGGQIHKYREAGRMLDGDTTYSSASGSYRVLTSFLYAFTFKSI